MRTVGALLWLAVTCYGHAVFSLMAQKHAGELRAAVPQAVAALKDAVDATMVEMQEVHPPLRRTECECLIRAALAAHPTERASADATPPAVLHRCDRAVIHRNAG